MGSATGRPGGWVAWGGWLMPVLWLEVHRSPPEHRARVPVRRAGFAPGEHPEERLPRASFVVRPFPTPANCGWSEPGYRRVHGSVAASWSEARGRRETGRGAG